MSIKEPTNDIQKEFFNLLLDGLSVKEAAKQTDYGPSYGYELVRKFKEYYLDLVESKLVLHAGPAVTQLIASLHSKGEDIAEDTKIKIAKDILDRVGLAKKDRLDINLQGEAGIVILPSKDNDDKDKD
jgi:hypothetical protein